jgi:diguanylate cyclase (GGDEF)-like protein
MTIDGRTLLEVAAVLSLLLGVLVLSLEWRLSQPMPGLRLWALAAFAIGAGSALSALRGLVGAWVPIGLGVPLFLSGRALQVAALRRFDQRRPHDRLLAGSLVVVIVGVLLANAGWPQTIARPLLVAVAAAILSGAAALSVLTGAALSAARLAVGASLSGLVAVNVWRAMMVLGEGHSNIATELQSPLVGLQVGAMLVLDVVMSAGMMLLISERMHDWVLQLSRHDHLTGVLARGALISQATHELQRARRLGTPTAAFLVDIDHFKGINDSRGHPTGDRVLQHVALQGRHVLRCTDLFGRYGGDEFVAVLPDTDLLTAAAIAERLRMAVCAPTDERDLPPLSVSIGVAAVAPDTQGLADLVAEADEALYNAKRGGRNRVGVGDRAQGPVNTSLRVLQGRR